MSSNAEARAQSPEPGPNQAPYAIDLAITGRAFATKDEAELALRTVCHNAGYTFSRRGYSRQKKMCQYNPHGPVWRFDYYCPNGGRPKNSANAFKATGQRQATSTKTGCEWRAKIVCMSGEWRVNFVGRDPTSPPCNWHNHKPMADLMEAPAYRRWWRAQHNGLVEGWVERLSVSGKFSSEKMAKFLRGEIDLDLNDLPGDDDDSDMPAIPHAPPNPSIDTIDPNFRWGDHAPQNVAAAPTPAQRFTQRPQAVPILSRDIQNIQSKIYREKYDPVISIQLFVNQLEQHQRSDGIVYKVYREAGRITRVFWTFQWCLNLWKKQPELLMVDNTFKVNRFNMPLCQFTGTTSLHVPFCIAFAFTSGGTETDFTWVLTELKSLALELRIPEPKTMITDFCPPFKNTAARLYPNTHQQLCLWHVSKNIAYHAKKKWRDPDADLETTSDRNEADEGSEEIPTMAPGLQGPGPDTVDDSILAAHTEAVESAAALATLLMQQQEDYDNAYLVNDDEVSPSRSVAPGDHRRSDTPDGFVMAWQQVTSADTEEEFWDAWKAIVSEFDRQLPLLRHIEKHYLPWRSQWARYSIKNILNYGIYTSTRGEVAYTELNKHLTSRLATLFKLYRAFRNLVVTKKNIYLIQHDKEDAKPFIDLEMMHFLAPLSRKISRGPLRKVYFQYMTAQAEQKSGEATVCSEQYRSQWGLPCKHEIAAMLAEEKVMDLRMVDKHWHLKEDMPLSTARRDIVPLGSRPGLRKPTQGPSEIPSDATVDAISKNSRNRTRARPNASSNEANTTARFSPHRSGPPGSGVQKNTSTGRTGTAPRTAATSRQAPASRAGRTPLRDRQDELPSPSTPAPPVSAAPAPAPAPAPISSGTESAILALLEQQRQQMERQNQQMAMLAAQIQQMQQQPPVPSASSQPYQSPSSRGVMGSGSSVYQHSQQPPHSYWPSNN